MVKPDVDAMWIDPVVLSNEAKNELAMIIASEVDSDTFKRVESLLIDCAMNQKVYGAIENGSNQKEFEGELQSIRKAFGKCKRVVAGMSGMNSTLLDQSCWYANNYDETFLEEAPDKLGSRVVFEVEKLMRGVEFHLDNMSKASKERYEYSRALADLADQFCIIFPDRKPSKEPMSLFYQLVVFWFNYCLGNPIVDPARHIAKILKS